MKKVIISLCFLMAAGFCFGQSVEAAEVSAKNDLSASDFAPSVQTAMSNPDYMVTAGDVYSLNYAAGSSVVSYTIPVDSTYKIRVSNLAVLDVKGKSYLELKKEVENIVVRNYPMSGVQFVLLNPASFKVIVRGEVSSTMEKSAWSLTRLSTVVSSGLTPYSSTRKVTVKSLDGKSRNYDLFKARREGDLSQDPYLRPGDIITINRMDRKVTIGGAVERPGTYELLPGENLKKLVEYYGNGLTELANIEKIELTRTRNGANKSGDKIYIDGEAIQQDYVLNDRDSVNITSLTSLMPTIIVEGIIANPHSGQDGADNSDTKNSSAPLDTSYRTYVRFYTGENYATLVRRISGMFNSYSDLKNAYFEREGNKIPLNIEHILYDKELMSEHSVMANDHLVIPYQQHLQKVLITGEVKRVVEENAWPLKRLSAVIADNRTDYSSTRNVLVRSVDGVETVYDLFKASREGDMSQDPYIHSGETIVVNRMERKVSISGAVERPGTYELLPGENLKELVEYYGYGLVPLADTSRIEVLRALSVDFKSGEKIYLKENHIEDNFELFNHDSVVIYSYSNLKPVVFVEGAVSTDTNESGTSLVSSNRIALTFNSNEKYAQFVRNHRGMFKSVSDTEHAYIIRKGEIIPVNLDDFLYDASVYSDLVVQEDDILMIPFRQFFVTVAGAVKNPGRFPYIPDRDWDYYIGLAGGFDKTKNRFDSVEIVDVNGKNHKKKEKIGPEFTITANTNSMLYFFNQYAPVLTTILSTVSTTITLAIAIAAL